MKYLTNARRDLDSPHVNIIVETKMPETFLNNTTKVVSA